MKAIVDNMLFDTETAEQVLPQPLLGSALYRTHNGNWFLCRSAELGDRWSITPIGRLDAQKLLEQHPDLYEKFFGKPKEA